MASSTRSPRSPLDANNIQPYRMHVSQRYLDLTKKKLELTRLPREPQSSQHQHLDFGVSKESLEPLVDHWLEQYDWRTQETFYNDALPQYRTVVNGTRMHFVHRRSRSTNSIPLLFVHGFPESFIAVAPMIEALCDPITTPPRGTECMQAFNVVCPSIPGFGFSDATPEEGNALPTTAAMFDSLMKSLGYQRYIAHGSGWGFRICRLLALGYPSSCIAIHTVNPEVPAPRSGFGYVQEDLFGAGSSLRSPGLTPPPTPGEDTRPSDRPQTLAYALCDSPTGLLAYMLDAIRPPRFGSASRHPQGLSPFSAGSSPVMSRSPASPQAVGQPNFSMGSPGSIELPGLSTVWTPTATINWTMIYWLPGPEVALRWLANSMAVLPSLWVSHSSVPLGITHFRDPISPSTGTGQTPPQWAEAYHRVAIVTRREGRVRFPAWERPAEVVMDIRELAGIIGAASTFDT
ncbi:hypothetical protein LTR53_001152 [Teratosphaeriaceae sp. CCFEE 6253]|nr:hypothetical protein LTR53_001152 [Teratosphaeriaceae sp. CCFEE 6253]